MVMLLQFRQWHFQFMASLSLGVSFIVPEHPDQFPLLRGGKVFYQGLLPDFSKVLTHLNNVYSRTTAWTDDLGICSCLEMAPRDLPNLCKSTLLLRSALDSLDFLVLIAGQFNEACKNKALLSLQWETTSSILVMNWYDHNLNHDIFRKWTKMETTAVKKPRGSHTSPCCMYMIIVIVRHYD